MSNNSKISAVEINMEEMIRKKKIIRIRKRIIE